MPTARHDLQSIAVDDRIYAISGADDLTLDVVEIYDVNTDTWRAGPPIPTRRGWSGATLLANKIYVACGKTIRTSEEKEISGFDYHFTPRDVLEVLDLQTQTWSFCEPVPGKPRAGVGVTDCQGKVYVIGGNTMHYQMGMVLNSVEVYDPQGEEWSRARPLPLPLQGPGVETVDGIIYVFGGVTEDGDPAFRSETYAFDPDVGKWEPVAPMPTGRESCGTTVLGGKIYTCGGRSPEYCATTEIYDPRTDTWAADAPLPEGKAWLDAAAVGGRIFAMGGAYKLPGPGFKWIDQMHELVL